MILISSNSSFILVACSYERNWRFLSGSTLSAVLKKAPYASGSDIRRRGTSRPEPIAAAHAGSFSMTLAYELGKPGYRPLQFDTTVTVTMEHIAAGWTTTQIHLDVIATVPKVAQGDFVDAALRAKANCPISRSLNANISMRAKLSERGCDRAASTPASKGFLRNWFRSRPEAGTVAALRATAACGVSRKPWRW